ncbi:UNVERIFIED_CONTAM: hypothetical protein Sindi_1568700, partial [Sesamum indicum]
NIKALAVEDPRQKYSILTGTAGTLSLKVSKKMLECGIQMGEKILKEEWG